VTVGNAAGAGPTGGTVTVTETLPTGLGLVSMSGSGWACGSGNCTRNDALNGGSVYPAITVGGERIPCGNAGDHPDNCDGRRIACRGSNGLHHHSALQRTGGAGSDSACQWCHGGFAHADRRGICGYVHGYEDRGIRKAGGPLPSSPRTAVSAHTASPSMLRRTS
jgi:hypothetical protein